MVGLIIKMMIEPLPWASRITACLVGDVSYLGGGMTSKFCEEDSQANASFTGNEFQCCLSGRFPRSPLGGSGEHSVREKAELPSVSLCQCFYFLLRWSEGRNLKTVPKQPLPEKLT